MVNAFSAIRQFERFLFRGVPEHPEPTWQRKINANVTDRHTGRSQLPVQSSGYDTSDWRPICKIVYKPDKEQIEFVRDRTPDEGGSGGQDEC